VANGMPRGSVLLCSTTNATQQKILAQVSAHLKRKGHRVRTLCGADRCAHVALAATHERQEP
jgi:hypothetical protein